MRRLHPIEITLDQTQRFPTLDLAQLLDDFNEYATFARDDGHTDQAAVVAYIMEAEWTEAIIQDEQHDYAVNEDALKTLFAEWYTLAQTEAPAAALAERWCVAWCAKSTPTFKGCGQPILSQAQAEIQAEAMNREYPEFLHSAIPESRRGEFASKQ